MRIDLPSADIKEVYSRVKALKPQGIAELKVSVAEAKKALVNNGMDEVYLRFNNKDYVAFGKPLKVKDVIYFESPPDIPFASYKHVFHKKELNGVQILDKTSEVNTFLRGFKSDELEDKKGLTITSGMCLVGAVAGGVVGYKGAYFPGALVGTTLGGGFGTLVGVVTERTIQGVSAVIRKKDLNSINMVSKNPIN